MTALTWVLLSAPSIVSRVIMIFAAGYVLFAAGLAHSIVSASVLMVGVFEAPQALGQLVVWMLLATVGNLVGGVGLVTLFRLVQANEQKQNKT
jgi:formate/nitrite transporter FocA (FNT family)